MSQVEFLLLIFFLFLITMGVVIVGAYIPSYQMWIKYTNNCINVFEKENIKNISFIIKEYKYKYIIWFILFSLISCISLGVFLDLIISDTIYSQKNLNGIIWIIPFILIWLFSYVLIFILFKKFWKRIKQIGIVSKKEALVKFQIFQEEIKTENIKIFVLQKFNQDTIQNHPFQFQQKRYKRKVIKLTLKFNNKKINQEKYQIKLLKLFTIYLKIYAIFLTRIRIIENYSVVVENIKEINILNSLPQILINNFFAFVNQAEQEFKNKD